MRDIYHMFFCMHILEKLSFFIFGTLGFYHRLLGEKRWVTLTDSGIPKVKSSSFPNGVQPGALSKTSCTVAPATKSSASWDEDWGPVSKVSSTAY
jgi:hypothetical protein